MIHDIIVDPGIAAYVESRETFLDFMVDDEALDELILLQDNLWRAWRQGTYGKPDRMRTPLTGQELLALVESTEVQIGVDALVDLAELPPGQQNLLDGLSTMLERRSGFDYKKTPDSWVDAVYREYLKLIEYPLEDSFK